jgi:RNase P protein component
MNRSRMFENSTEDSIRTERWRTMALNQQKNTHFWDRKGNKDDKFGTGFFVHKKIGTAVKRI